MRSARVLVVDDHALIRRTVSLLLSGAGYDVTEAASGEQALALAARDRPDAVTIDYELPDTDGLALAGRLRAVPGLESAPLILITSREFAGGCADTPLPYVNAYLSKEELADALLPCIETHLGGIKA